MSVYPHKPEPATNGARMNCEYCQQSVPVDTFRGKLNMCEDCRADYVVIYLAEMVKAYQQMAELNTAMVPMIMAMQSEFGIGEDEPS